MNLNPADIKVLQDFIRRIRNFTVGPGMVMKNEPGGLYVGLAPRREYRPTQTTTSSNSFPCRITAVTGTFPVWSYTVQHIIGYDSSQTGPEKWVTDGVDIEDVLNADEFEPPTGTYPYQYGNGSNITDSDGTIDGGSCVIIPIGVGARVQISVTKDIDGGAMVYSFEEPNGSEAA